MNYSKESLAGTLVEVRKAYRLLHDYQRMVLDAVQYIGAQFGMSCTGGYPQYSNAAKPGIKALDSWAWDWLNMVCYEFKFNRVKGDEILNLSLVLVSDSGYFESEAENSHKTQTQTYKKVENSQSKIIFISSTKKGDFPTIGNREVMKNILMKQQHSENLAEQGMFTSVYDLTEIENIERCNAMLNDFQRVAQSHGIDLERVNQVK